MKVLVTGGTGVVGVAAIPALLRAGHTVRLVTRHADRDAGSFPDGVEPFEADVSSGDSLDAALEGCEAVLHIAGIVEEDPPEITFDKVNVEGTRHLVDAAGSHGHPYFVFVSSLGAERGQSEYHQSKRRAESFVRAYAGPWLIFRPGGVYGPGDETISTLLKMVRTLPAVPMVSEGDQPFQPLWYADLGEVLAQAVGRRELAGKTLDIAGAEVTTTDTVIGMLGAITGRQVPKLAVPVWVTEVGVQAMEAFGATGRKLLRSAGIEPPLSPAKLDMLLEENVIPHGSHNALQDFSITPTTLQDGLTMLADMVPEQLPGDGVGAVHSATYWAEIHDANVNAAGLLDRVTDHMHDVMPIEFAAEPGTPHKAEPGATLTGTITGRGNIQVKLEERTETRATFLTLEGHPLAGVMQFHAEDAPGALRFNVHIASQPANAFDWLAMQTVGGPMQRANWRAVVKRVIELSGGHAPTGVHYESHRMDDREVSDIRKFAERVVKRQNRVERTAAVEGK